MYDELIADGSIDEDGEENVAAGTSTDDTEDLVAIARV